uniref:Uncharacterized protein n=1 Tax=Callithrix jacchus TaxID=9483 RepID=A0A8I3WVZ1_CALJA
MAVESGSDLQQRRRRHRDPEEPEKTELSERELAVAVAVAEKEERWVRPLPVEATPATKKKVLAFERVCLDNLPSASIYERSYVHRDVITHVVSTSYFYKLHTSPLTQIQLNPVYKAVVSSDKSGMIEYWTGPPLKYKFPKTVNWEYKTE